MISTKKPFSFSTYLTGQIIFILAWLPLLLLMNHFMDLSQSSTRMSIVIVMVISKIVVNTPLDSIALDCNQKFKALFKRT